MSEGLEGGRLKSSAVAKVTSLVGDYTAGEEASRNGRYFVARDYNSSGTLPEETCPGATPTCLADCYAIESTRRDPTAKVLRDNTEILAAATTVEGKFILLDDQYSEYEEQAERLGIKEGKRFYRRNWSGDYNSFDYAAADALAMAMHRGIDFFVFTRSFQPDLNVIPALVGVYNLDLFMSVDIDNIDRAREVLDQYPDMIRVAYLVDTFGEEQELIEKLGRQKENGFHTIPCPENVIETGSGGKRKIPLISEKGGACSVCRYCFGRASKKRDPVKSNKRDVVFLKNGNGQVVFSGFTDVERVEISPKRKAVAETAETPVELIVRSTGEVALAGARQESFF